MQHVAFEQCLFGVFLAAEVVIALLYLPLHLDFSLLVTVLRRHLLLVGLSSALLGQLREERLHRFEVGFGMQEGQYGLIDGLVDLLAIIGVLDVRPIDEPVDLLVGRVGQVVEALAVDVLLDPKVVVDGFVFHGRGVVAGLSEPMREGVAEGNVVELAVLPHGFLGDEASTCILSFWV